MLYTIQRKTKQLYLTPKKKQWNNEGKRRQFSLGLVAFLQQKKIFNQWGSKITENFWVQKTREGRCEIQKVSTFKPS